MSDGVRSGHQASSEAELIGDLGRCAVELATGAADVVRARTSGEQHISSKTTSTDLVTDTDRATEDWIMAWLARRRPQDALLGEEGPGREGTSGVRWVVDPIDGTVNFVLGIPMYAVSIAAESGGRVVAAAVANPVTGELFRATLGGGAYAGGGGFGAGRRLTGPRDVPLARAVIGTGFGYDPDRRARQAAVTAALLPRIADIRRLGSAALDICAVAAGRLDGYFEVGLNPWDHAAAVLIAREAGALAVGPNGHEPDTALAVVGGPQLMPELTAALDELGIAQVL